MTKIPSRTLSIYFVSIVFVALVLAIFFVSGKNKDHIPPAPTDLLTHPTYSKYSFSPADNVISLGTQPLYFPTGLITECLRRDDILRQALAEEGMELQFHAFFKGSDVNFFLRQGMINVGVGGDMPALTLAADHEIIIPVLIQYGPISIVAKEHMLLKDLRGKRVGYAVGSNAHYVLLDLLASAGLEEGDVHLIPMDIDQMVGNLRDEKIDAFSAWEPTPEIASRKYGFIASHKSLSSGYLYFDRPFFDKHPSACRLIVAAEVRAIRWLKKDRQNLMQASRWVIMETLVLSGRKLELSAEQVAVVAGKDILGLNSILEYVIPSDSLDEKGTLNREFLFLKDIGKIAPDIQWEKVRNSFDSQIMHEITLSPKEFRLNEFSYGH